ncbi:MAG TPA: hypothetical protein VGI78_10625 [Acetobacteraceae bacterium]
MASEYQHIRDYDGVLRYADNATVPPDPANRDWQQWLVYTEAGGITDPAPPPSDPPPPEPDPNQRLDTGVAAAVIAYEALTPPPAPAQQPGGTGGLSTEERLLRLEETVQALCNGQMFHADTPPFARSTPA